MPYKMWVLKITCHSSRCGLHKIVNFTESLFTSVTVVHESHIPCIIYA